MSSYGQILSAECLNAHQNNLGFLMRSPRTNEHLSVLMDALVRETRAIQNGVFVRGRRFSPEGLLTTGINGTIVNDLIVKTWIGIRVEFLWATIFTRPQSN